MNLSDEDLKMFATKYSDKKASTKYRKDKLGNPIEFRLTFEEYIQLYLDKGVYPSRQYVLSRFNDIGHYEIGNVAVIHTLENISEANGKTSEMDKKINDYCIKNGYFRRIVKGMIKRGELTL